MNPIQIIAALRKFGNYLAGLFPWFVTAVNFLTGLLGKILEHPRIAPRWKKFKDNKLVQPTWKVVERFYWRTYSKNRLDLTGAPVETVALLRPIFQMCAILCMLIPLTSWNLWAVKITAFSGFEGIAPGWAVVLWMISLPCAWAALLTGAARSNRIAFMVAAICASYFLITCVVLLPRSFFNICSPLALLIGLLYCEYRCREDTTKFSTALGLLNSIVCGIAAGIPFLILTPIRPFLGTIINLPGPVISIGGGALIGSLIGLGCFKIARNARFSLFSGNVPEAVEARAADALEGKTGGAEAAEGESGGIAAGEASREAAGTEADEASGEAGSGDAEEGEAKRTYAMAVCAWSIALLLSVYLFAGLARGDLAQSGSQLISSLTLTTSYFWPLWYFMGVGILHKISKSSKTLANSIGDVLPAKSVKPLLIALLCLSMIVAFSQPVCVLLSKPSAANLVSLLPLFFAIYNFFKPWIWSDPLTTLAVHWFSYVLLFDCVLVCILAVQRRVTNEALVRLLFLNVFAFLLVWEYVFQMSSFLRTPTHSLTLLFLFAVGLLWLLHTVGWDLSSKSSPAWPSPGRLAVYGGIALFALLEIFARTACKDFKLMNEIFLAMFHGVIDIGLPYYFLVWTTNRVKKLPLTIPPLLGVFCLGALTGLAFNVLEKFCAVGWSIPLLTQTVNAQCQSLRELGSINIDLVIPGAWFLIRTVLYISLLALVYVFAKRKIGERENVREAVLFLLVAFGSGIASFSMTLVELPLPPEVRALLAPCKQELLFNCNLFQSYLAYWIPALILGLSQLYGRSRPGKMFLFAIPLAMASHFLISWSYSHFEVYWRADSSLYTLMMIPVGLFMLLVALFLKHVAPQLEESDRDKKATLLTPVTLIAAVATVELVLIPWAICQSHLKFERQQVLSVSHEVPIATTWRRTDEKNTQSASANPNAPATFVRTDSSGGVSLLQIGVIDSEGLESRQLLKKLLVKASESGRYPSLAVVSVEPWGKYRTNALACSFSYELPQTKPPVTMAGLSILVPRSADQTEFYTLYTSPSEIEHEQFELAYMLKNTTP
ncbi:MAG: hypothetical protein EKK48_23240 [Candidatus Melainabacteria bacterium]|nr:MAG: hypothetical protein EKK48_23240 [Candidatus Melainabacteria bacterium]